MKENGEEQWCTKQRLLEHVGSALQANLLVVVFFITSRNLIGQISFSLRTITAAWINQDNSQNTCTIISTATVLTKSITDLVNLSQSQNMCTVICMDIVLIK